jgi:hypothetical protein
MALVSAGSLAAAGIFVVVGIFDAANPLSGIYFFFAAAAALAAGLAALTARGLWRDRRWAWAILGVLGLLIAMAAYQINQAYDADGSLLSFVPITPYLAPIAAAGLALLGLAAVRAFGGRRGGTQAAP